MKGKTMSKKLSKEQEELIKIIVAMPTGSWASLPSLTDYPPGFTYREASIAFPVIENEAGGLYSNIDSITESDFTATKTSTVVVPLRYEPKIKRHESIMYTEPLKLDCTFFYPVPLMDSPWVHSLQYKWLTESRRIKATDE